DCMRSWSRRCRCPMSSSDSSGLAAISSAVDRTTWAARCVAARTNGPSSFVRSKGRGDSRGGNSFQPSELRGDERRGDERCGDERCGDELCGGERCGDERCGDERCGDELCGDERCGDERRS